jgi:hypothetical protein
LATLATSETDDYAKRIDEEFGTTYGVPPDAAE